MPLDIRNTSGRRGIRFKPLREVCEKILKDMKTPKAEVSLLFVDDKQISKMNKKYLDHKGPTDVISFSLYESDLSDFKPPVQVLGDIIISADTAMRQAKELGHSFNTEIRILFIHGMFHLYDYNDQTEYDKCEMLKMEMKYR